MEGRMVAEAASELKDAPTKPPVNGVTPVYEHDFEDPSLDVNGIVIDYLCSRLEKEGIAWEDAPDLPDGVHDVHRAVRLVASIFERRHFQELNNLVSELMTDDQINYSHYCAVVEGLGCSDGAPMRMSYGRLVGLLAFAGVTAVAMAREDRPLREVAMLAAFTARFIDQKIRQSWPSERRSWADFQLMAAEMQRRDVQRRVAEEGGSRRRDSRRLSLLGLAVAGVVGLGALTIHKVVFSR